jgi:hypothetical protein
MPRPKFRVVSMDEVKICRESDRAIFSYADEKMGGWDIDIGPQVHQMSDRDLLAYHNNMVLNMEANSRNYEHIAVEIPIGKPQIEYNKQCRQWSAKGDVLRCYITSARDANDGALEPAIEIDDKTLSWKEFGRLLTTYEGWGMRLIIVPDDELHETPNIQIMKSRNEKFEQTEE